MPAQASGGMVSPIRPQAISAAIGGTRNSSAETREASPWRIIANSSVIAISDGASNRYAAISNGTAWFYFDGTPVLRTCAKNTSQKPKRKRKRMTSAPAQASSHKHTRHAAAPPQESPPTDIHAGVGRASMHMGFAHMRVQPGVVGHDQRDGLEHRMMFTYQSSTVNAQGDAVLRTEDASLHDIVNTADPIMRRMHTAALFDFMVFLYTCPPTGYARMHALLGDHDPLGSFVPRERERLQRLFERHAAAEADASQTKRR